jgi:hypothetical protein
MFGRVARFKRKFDFGLGTRPCQLPDYIETLKSKGLIEFEPEQLTR